MGKEPAQAQYLTAFFVYVIMKKTEIAQRRVTDEQARRIMSQGTVLGNTSYHKEPSPVTLTFPRLITN